VPPPHEVSDFNRRSIQRWGIASAIVLAAAISALLITCMDLFDGRHSHRMDLSGTTNSDVRVRIIPSEASR
jgi:hypothetical protein